MFEIQPGSHPTTTGRRGCTGPFLFGAIFFGVGGVFAAAGAAMLWQYWEAQSWPTAPGVILMSRVDSQRGSKGGTTYACLVEYRFEVGGAPYVGKNLEPMTVYSSGDGAREDCAKLPPGTAVTVRYDPRDPNESCLRADAGVFQYVFFLVGLGAMSIGIAAWGVMWWKRGTPGA